VQRMLALPTRRRIDFDSHKLLPDTYHLYYAVEISVETSIVEALVLAAILCTKYAECCVLSRMNSTDRSPSGSMAMWKSSREEPGTRVGIRSRHISI
jgi:hypothetical protein